MTVRTDLEWSYKPTDFFEAPLDISATYGRLVFETGSTTYTLSAPTDPVPKALLDDVEREVSNCLAVRQLLAHRPFAINGPRIVQHQTGGGRNAVAMVKVGAHTVSSIGHADVVTRDETGQVVRDTRAERIIADYEFISAVLPAAMKSAPLSAMLYSFGQAVRDPGNELIHLYEIRDAAVQHFGTKEAAKTALRISKAEWSVLDRLANEEPIREGRHRGRRMGDLRSATAGELRAARAVAKQIIGALAAAK